ncbi:MAG: hypothetical protein B5M54_06030 [Candidatus Aminicenantes bacterium 4484_214]|nr:MAG: hypothetical protein B5M54_06030 [Candidatus Aminicenantes bacterium 4484_214]
MISFNFKRFWLFSIVVVLGLILFFAVEGTLVGEEGMYPISEIKRLNLQALGFEISAKDIYNPQGISLIQAIVQVGGCTGSFVSPQGLIVTNHHCAYRAVQAVSTREHDYIRNGFLAPSLKDEILAPGLTVRITVGYWDVTNEVLKVLKPGMEAAERAKAVEHRIKELVAQAEAEHPGQRAEVAEMFPGKSYVMFLYDYLKDIRLVYVPPRSIGEFGGEVDNWMWPRHTGDFSFLRAYVAPGGKPAEYSPENVPYQPKRLNKHLSRIKGLSNTMKNYRGKLLGLKRINLVAKKREEEEKLQNFINSSPELRSKYGDVLVQTNQLFHKNRQTAYRELILDYLRRDVLLLNTALTLWEASGEREKPDLERKSAYMDRNFPLTKRRLELSLRNYYEPTDKAIFKELLRKATQLPPDQRIKELDFILGGDKEKWEAEADNFLQILYARTKLTTWTDVGLALEKNREELKKINDPALELAQRLYPAYERLENERKKRKGQMDDLLARLIEVKQKFLGQEFIPDANRTLRLTFGRIKGYSPADAIYYRPFTTLRGVLEKSTGKPPFDTPSQLLELIKAQDYGSFRVDSLGSVPVCMLYDMDTTGGNSGSPIMDASGRLVGINFDRAFEATINDFAWSESYSRSIGVDMRYVLWVTEKIGRVERILEELGFSPTK